MMTKPSTLALSALATNLLVGCVAGDNLPAPIENPETCSEIAKSDHKAQDGEYTLFVGGDATKPWQAYCADLRTNAKEYLTLGDGISYSLYVAGGSSPGTDVRTEYDKVRIDPIALTLDTRDQTFAVSTGSVVDSNGVTVTSMPLGTAMTCGAGRASAQIGMEQTPFKIVNTFKTGGDPATLGHANPWSSEQTIEFWADGNCGWMAPDGAPNGMTGGADLIKLTYK